MESNLEKKSDEGNHHQEGSSPMVGVGSSGPLPPPFRDRKSAEKIEAAPKNINNVAAEKLGSFKEKLSPDFQDSDDGFSSVRDSGERTEAVESEESLEGDSGPPSCRICGKEFPLMLFFIRHPEKVGWRGMGPPAASGDGDGDGVRLEEDGESEEDNYDWENSDVPDDDDSANVEDGVDSAGRPGESPEKMELDDEKNQGLHDSVKQFIDIVKRDSLKNLEQRLEKERKESTMRRKSSNPNAKFKTGKGAYLKKMKFSGENDGGKMVDETNFTNPQAFGGNHMAGDDQIKVPVPNTTADGSAASGFTDGDHGNQTAGLLESKEMDLGGDDSKGKENIPEANFSE